MEEKKIKKIAIIGPESSGKTTISQAIANYFQTNYVPEYAREYLTKNGPLYTFNDLKKMAQKQKKTRKKFFKIFFEIYFL